MKEKIRILLQFGKGGLIIDEATAYVSTLDRASDLLAGVIRDFKHSDCTLLSMRVEILKDWEVK